MPSIVPGFRSVPGGVTRSAWHYAAACGNGRHAQAGRFGARAGRFGVRALRIALPFLASIGFSIVGADRSFASTPISCDAASVVDQALPAIVNITVVKVGDTEDTAASLNARASTAPNDHIAVFVGTGSVIDSSGIIVTNKHVIQGAAMIKVTFADKSEAMAHLIAAANLVDLALLKVDIPRPLPVLQFGNSDNLRLGQPVIAVGNPLGLGTSISTGVVSAVNRNLMRTPLDDFIQTDASINPGNSGGPLLDCSGQMVGVNTALVSNIKQLGSIGLGFALPSNDARFVASKLRSPDEDQPNWTGLHVQDLTSDIGAIFGHPDVNGAIVTSVDADSPAAQAGMQSGDIIMGADGHVLTDARAVLRDVIVAPTGAKIAFDVWRGDHSTQATIQTLPWPNMKALRSEVLASPASVAQAQAAGCGLHLAAITDADRQRYNLGDATGVLIDKVANGSEADTMGFRPGDVIEKVGNVPVATPEDVMAQTTHGSAASGDMVAMLVRGPTSMQWLTLFVGRVDLQDLVAGPDFFGRPNTRNASAGVTARQPAAQP
jgi:serine protease Do